MVYFSYQLSLCLISVEAYFSYQLRTTRKTRDKRKIFFFCPFAAMLGMRYPVKYTETTPTSRVRTCSSTAKWYGSCCDNCVLITDTTRAQSSWNLTKQCRGSTEITSDCAGTSILLQYGARITTTCDLYVRFGNYTMTLRHAPMNASMTPALPEFRVHTTMKCEHEHPT